MGNTTKLIRPFPTSVFDVCDETNTAIPAKAIFPARNINMRAEILPCIVILNAKSAKRKRTSDSIKFIVILTVISAIRK
jgi:hypothetical protein